MRRYHRGNRPPARWSSRQLPPASDPTELEIRSYGNEIVKAPEVVGQKTLHNLNGVIISRFWVSEPYNKGFVYELTYRGRYWAGKSPRDVFLKAREVYRRPPKKHVGEILAIRGWSIAGDVLYSIGQPDWNNEDRTWLGPIMHADVKPEMNNSSGLYAVKATPEAVNWLLKGYHPPVYGFVGMYGQIVEMTNGWRAEHMIVRRLILQLPASEAFQKILADRYECEVVLAKKFRGKA